MKQRYVKIRTTCAAEGDCSPVETYLLGSSRRGDWCWGGRDHCFQQKAPPLWLLLGSGKNAN